MLEQYHISSELNIKEQVEASEKPVVIAFCSSVSGICQMMRPIFEDFEYEYGTKVKLLIVEDVKCSQLSQKYNINQFPTILFIKNEEIVDRVEGILSRKELDQKINFLYQYNNIDVRNDV